MSKRIKRMWALLFYCEKCQERWAGGCLQFYLCNPCYTEVKVRAEKLKIEERMKREENRKKTRAAIETRRYEQMVKAMKQALLELQGQKL